MRTIPQERRGVAFPAPGLDSRHLLPVVVRAPRELDFLSGPQLLAMVERVVTYPPVPDVRLVLDGVEFIDVAGVRALLACREVVRMHGAELHFVSVPVPLERILEILPDLRRRFEEA
jgi:anti-anti-sigma factor